MEGQFITLHKLLDTYFNGRARDAEKVKASRSLIALSQREDFIDVAINMLMTEQTSSEKILLISCMIKDKFRYDFQLLNPQKIQGYYLILCEAAAKFGTDNKAIFSNISQSLALIYLNQITDFQMPLTDYLKCFTTEDPSQMGLFNYYFKIIEQCPQVTASTKVVVQQESRNSAKARLVKQQVQIITILEQAVLDVWYDPIISNQVSKKRVIECFQAWIDLKYDSQIYNSLHKTLLLQITVASLKDPQLAEQAAGCLKAIIENMQSPEKNQQLYTYLGGQLHQLLPYIKEKLKKNELYAVQDLIDLVVFFSQKSAEFLVQHYSPNIRNFLITLMDFMSTRIERVVSSLFQFWDDILMLFIKYRGDKKYQIDLQIDLPIILLETITQEIRYPPQFVKELDSVFETNLGSLHQQADQIYLKRFMAENVFSSLVQIMGTDYYVGYILQQVESLQIGTKQFFSVFESWLFALIYAYKKYDQIKNNLLAIVEIYENMVANIKEVPIIVKRTFLKIFKAIFSIPIQDYKLVEKLYQVTIDCFSDTMLIDLAARTFYKACEINPRYIHNYLFKISALIKNYPQEEFIYRAFVCLICYDQTTAYFALSQCLDFLIAYVSHEESPRRNECLHTINSTLKEIKVRNLDDKRQLFQEFVKSSWNFIVSTLKTPQMLKDDHDNKIERTVKLLKTLMRILRSDFVDYLCPLFEVVNQSFQEYPICSYMYLVEIAVTVFSGEPQLTQLLQTVYNQFTKSAFRHLQTPQSINKYSYLIDDFLGMNTRLLIYNTSIIVSSSHFPKIIQFITQDCKQATASKVIKANYSFLHTLFMTFWSGEFMQAYNQESDEDRRDDRTIQPKIKDLHIHQGLREYLLEELFNILRRMFEQLSQVPPEAAKNQIIDAILSSIKAFPQASPSIWQGLLEQLPSSVLLLAEKEQIVVLLSNIAKQMSNYEQVKGHMKKMSKFLGLIDRRMTIAYKRRRFNLKE